MIRNTETATMKEKYFESIIFPENEYRERYKKIQSLMKREGFQLLILTDDRYTWYYTGFGGAAPMGARCRPRILFIPATGDPVFLVHQSTMFCVNEMICFGKVAGYANLESMPVEQIKKCIAEFALGRGDVIGMEFGREMRININFQDVNNLIASCADYVFKDAADILIEQRTIKTELEIERIKKACSITSEAYKYGFPQIKSNMTELQIGGILENTMLELGAQGTWSWVIGSDYIRIDGLTRSKKVEEGALIFVDMGANVGGYWSDFSRTAVIGTPNYNYEEIYNKIVEICAAGVDACRIGNSTAEVGRLLDRLIENSGLEFSSKAERYGHGMGISVTEPPNIWNTDHYEIKENMVLTVEPGYFNDYGMFHIEENLLVTKDGPVYLSTAQRKIFYV